MSNGNPWTQSHTETLRQMAGRVPDRVIAEMTGHCERTIRDRRAALRRQPFHRKRIGWSRRDHLLAGAAGQNP